MAKHTNRKINPSKLKLGCHYLNHLANFSTKATYVVYFVFKIDVHSTEIFSLYDQDRRQSPNGPLSVTRQGRSSILVQLKLGILPPQEDMTYANVGRLRSPSSLRNKSYRKFSLNMKSNDLIRESL